MAALVAVALTYRHSLIAAGDAQGAARVQKSWDANKATIATLAAEAKAVADAQDAIDAAHNKEVIDDYHAQLKVAAGNAADFARRLRNAKAAIAAGRGAVSEGADQPGIADAGTQSTGARELDDATAALDLACRIDALQLDALIAEIRPQLLSHITD